MQLVQEVYVLLSACLVVPASELSQGSNPIKTQHVFISSCLLEFERKKTGTDSRPGVRLVQGYGGCKWASVVR